MNIKSLSPTTIIWVSCHIVMTFFGAIMLLLPQIRVWIGQGLAEGIGGSLIATGMAGTFLFIYVRRSDDVRDRLDVLYKAGVKTIFPHRSVAIRDEYESRLQNATNIDVIGYGLSHFREDFSGKFVEWSKRSHVRILLVNPDFPKTSSRLVDCRDQEEGHHTGKTRKDIKAFEELIKSLPLLDRTKFEIRRMNAIPSINMMRIDNEIFWGPFLIDRQSRNSPAILINKGGYMFEILSEHFEAIWERYSSPID